MMSDSLLFSYIVKEHQNSIMDEFININMKKILQDNHINMGRPGLPDRLLAYTGECFIAMGQRLKRRHDARMRSHFDPCSSCSK